MYEIPEETIRRIDEVRQRGGRILAVGTTVVRALEDAARKARKIGRGSPLRKGAGEAHLFIFPGHEFLAVDMLLTNFHLPRSTLLMLVSAFAGMEQTRAAYRAAREEEYRFYSYGDAMLIA
jgi:S-adenosylmethionine:tRNA ribosyltransferase-isomerase